jgi:hypothetical protein
MSLGSLRVVLSEQLLWGQRGVWGASFPILFALHELESGTGVPPNTVALSRKPRRGLLVRTIVTLVNTIIPALTSRALLAKREVNATGLGVPPVVGDGSAVQEGTDFVKGASVHTAGTAVPPSFSRSYRKCFVESRCHFSDVKTCADLYLGNFLWACFGITEGRLSERWSSMCREAR